MNKYLKYLIIPGFLLIPITTAHADESETQKTFDTSKMIKLQVQREKKIKAIQERQRSLYKYQTNTLDHKKESRNIALDPAPPKVETDAETYEEPEFVEYYYEEPAYEEPGYQEPITYEAPPAPSEGIEAGVQFALAQIGKPYIYGGNGPWGYDCSGLTSAAFGISPAYRTAAAQSAMGTPHYDVHNAPRGALLFWGGVGSAYHVGISLGNGQYVHAANEAMGILIGGMGSAPSHYIVI